MDCNITTAPAEEVVETGPSQEWFEARRTTPEEHASAAWAEQRNRDIDAHKAIKQSLGLEYDAYRQQLDELSSDERLDLVDKSAEEIAELLDTRTEAGRELKKLEKQAKEQAAEHFEPIETPHLREVRKAMKTAYKDAASLDERIAELKRLNKMRADPTHEGWDDEGMDADTWRLARERKLDSFDSDIAAAIQEKQARLQEAGLHQAAYHEEARATQPRSMPDRPIGQIVGNDGRPMQVTKADIATLVQLERDDQAHKDRALEARKHYPDWEQQARSAVAAGVDVTNQQAAFIKTLPNSADVVYYLTTHHDETRALLRMSSHEATRALINISHKVARPAEAAPKKTTAPKPPSPVGGTSRGAFDVNDESGSADDWMRRRNADLRKRGKL